jgi:hypothetical protein
VNSLPLQEEAIVNPEQESYLPLRGWPLFGVRVGWMVLAVLTYYAPPFGIAFLPSVFRNY